MLDDPYIDQHSGILRNKRGFTTLKEFNGFESEKTRTRLFELDANPLPGNFDLQ